MGEKRHKCMLWVRARTELCRFVLAYVYVRKRVHAPDLGFRIHLTRTIDHECMSDRAAHGPPQKSSYLHSPRVVGFRIKRRATGVAPCHDHVLRAATKQPSMSHKFIGNAVHEITEDRRSIIGFNETREFIRGDRRRGAKFKIS